MFGCRECRKVDKQAVMTMVFKRSSPGHPSRCMEDEVVMAVDQANQRVLHYERVAQKKVVGFPVVSES